MKATSFGANARQYSRLRPGYPDAVGERLRVIAPGLRLLDVGAGTGKASALFAAHGFAVTAIEPDPDMAAILAEELPDQNIEVVGASFEDCEPEGPFDVVAGAHAWHWVQPDVRYEKSAALLGHRGIFAAIWNITRWPDDELAAQIRAIYRRRAPDLAADIPAYPGVWPYGDALEASAIADIEASGLFNPVDVDRFCTELSYSADDFVGLIGTDSYHADLPPERRQPLLDEIAEAVDDAGGADFVAETLLFTTEVLR